MRIEFQTRKFPEVACDMLAYPVFAGEKADSPTLVSLDKATRGIVAAVLGSGEFKTDLHHLCVIHHPASLKAGRLLLIGAGKKEEFTLAILRQIASWRGPGVMPVARASPSSTAATMILAKRFELLPKASCTASTIPPFTRPATKMSAPWTNS
jgi:hypothetical protein